MRNVFVILATVLIVGCSSTSQYHLGTHYLGGESPLLFGAISEKVDEPTKIIEVQFASALVRYDATKLGATFSGQLLSKLDGNKLSALLEEVRLKYALSGQYDRMALGRHQNSHDEAVLLYGPFEYYDLVRADFLLKGKQAAVVRIYTTMIGADVRVCGFAIYPVASDGSYEKPSQSYIEPESIDKAKITGRMYRVVK